MPRPRSSGIRTGRRTLQETGQRAGRGTDGPECEETSRINGHAAPFERTAEHVQIQWIKSRKEEPFRNSSYDEGGPENPDNLLGTRAANHSGNLAG